MKKLLIHIGLTRPFALPIVVVCVLLGVFAVGTLSITAIYLVLSGVFMMAYAHTLNSYLDYYWTKLDQGDHRSKAKPYTGGQQYLADGRITGTEILINGTICLSISALFAFLSDSPTVWLPWLILTPLTFWYSWAKLHWHPEIPLTLGFGTCSTWLGMAAAGNIDWLRGLIISLPVAFLFGVVCEAVDQAIDVEENWAKGLRNLGAWLKYKYGILYGTMIAVGSALTYGIQLILVPQHTGYTPMAAALLLAAVITIDRWLTLGLILGLLGVFTYSVLYLLTFF